MHSNPCRSQPGTGRGCPRHPPIGRGGGADGRAGGHVQGWCHGGKGTLGGLSPERAFLPAFRPAPDLGIGVKSIRGHAGQGTVGTRCLRCPSPFITRDGPAGRVLECPPPGTAGLRINTARYSYDRSGRRHGCGLRLGCAGPSVAGFRVRGTGMPARIRPRTGLGRSGNKRLRLARAGVPSRICHREASAGLPVRGNFEGRYGLPMPHASRLHLRRGVGIKCLFLVFADRHACAWPAASQARIGVPEVRAECRRIRCGKHRCLSMGDVPLRRERTLGRLRA